MTQATRRLGAHSRLLQVAAKRPLPRYVGADAHESCNLSLLDGPKWEAQALLGHLLSAVPCCISWASGVPVRPIRSTSTHNKYSACNLRQKNAGLAAFSRFSERLNCEDNGKWSWLRGLQLAELFSVAF